MNGMKSLFVCVLIALLGNRILLAETKAPEGGESAKPAAKTEQKPIEKSPIADDSNQADVRSSEREFCQCIGRDNNAASSKRIEQALAAPLHQPGLDYVDQPLQDVVAQLSDEYGIPIQLDKVALEEAGIGTDSKVSITLHKISLSSALRLVLRTLQLTWIIQDEVLMITTKESAEKNFDTCVYNVQGLVDDSDPKSAKALIDAIYACVQTDTWAVNGGGDAEVRPLPSGLLVVSQTPAVQEEVSALLNKIRKMREKVPLAKVGPRGYEPPPGQSPAHSSRIKKESASPKTASNGG